VTSMSSSFFVVDRHHRYYSAPVGAESDPPGDLLGGWAGICEVLGESATATVSIIITRAYPTGVEFMVEGRVTPGSGYDAAAYLDFYKDDAADIPDERPPDELLRIGLEYPSGGRMSTLPWSVQQVSPDALVPLLWFTSGSASSKVFTADFWVSPLPTPGHLEFVIEWPLMDIPEQVRLIPCASILEAAGRARPLGQPPDAR